MAGRGISVAGAEGASGAGSAGFGCRVGSRVVERMFRNPRRTLAGVSRPGAAGRSHGRRRSATRGRASRSWVCAAMTSQVQRSPATERLVAHHQSARTTHPPARSASHTTRGGTRQDHPARSRCHPRPQSGQGSHSASRPPLSSSSSVRGTRKESSGGRSMSRRHTGRAAGDLPLQHRQVTDQAWSTQRIAQVRGRNSPPLVMPHGVVRLIVRCSSAGGIGDSRPTWVP